MARVIPLPGGAEMTQEEGLFPLTQDSVLLAGFVSPKKGERALDLGCGQGVLGLILLSRFGDLTVDGIELTPNAAAAARGNYARCGFSSRGEILCGDLRALPTALAGKYDFCLSNPPYFDPGRGAVARGEALACARSAGCTPDELCAAACRALRWGGRFFLCYRAERLAGLIAALSRHRLAPKRLRLVHHQPGRDAVLILLEARKGGGEGISIPPPLYMRDEAGEYTAEVLEIYR